MRVRATIEFDEGVMVGVGPAPREGAFIEIPANKDAFELALYMDGVFVGTTVGWPTLNWDTLEEAGGETHRFVTGARIDCNLELPTGDS